MNLDCKPVNFLISDEALNRVITHYTREAGVRELQRRIAEICRTSTMKVLAPSAVLPIQVELKDLDEILGAERFNFEVAERAVPPGVVTEPCLDAYGW